MCRKGLDVTMTRRSENRTVFREASPQNIKRVGGFHRTLEYNRITFAGSRGRGGEKRRSKSRSGDDGRVGDVRALPIHRGLGFCAKLAFCRFVFLSSPRISPLLILLELRLITLNSLGSSRIV